MAKFGCVQRAFVPVHALEKNALVLAFSHAPAARDLIGILEVSGLNYPLKSEAEQQRINDLFQVVLASLTYPLQVLMCVMPFELEGYFVACGLEKGEQELGNAFPDLSTSYAAFLRDRARTRMLMQRRFYVIVPAGQTVHEETTTLFHHMLRRIRSKGDHAEGTQAHHQLELRCTELTRQLSAMGLAVRRLHQRECLDLTYRCLCVQKAQDAPLQDAWIEGIREPSTSHANGQMKPLSTQEQEDKSLRPFHKDQLRFPTVADLLAPAGIQVMADALVIEQEWVQVNEVVALPRVITPGWFNRLASIAVPMDLCIAYTPLPTARTMRELQRARFVVSTSNVLDSERGRRDPVTRVAQDDIEGLMDRMASGEDRLLEFSMRFVVRGSSRDALLNRAAQVRATLQSMLLKSQPCWFEQDKAFRACLPHGRNELRRDQAPIALASHEASATFPFLSGSLMMATGLLEGITHTGEPVILDWWAKTNRNANRLIVAPSGAGKSFKAKLDIIRAHLLYNRRDKDIVKQHGLTYQTLIVDIEREYVRITNLLEGQCLRFAPGTLHALNPFDLPHAQQMPPAEGHFDALAEKVSQLLALLDILLTEHTTQGGGRLTPSEKGLLDRTLYECYREKGMTSDPATHHFSPPVLSDLARLLSDERCGRDTTGLADRLHRFVSGSLSSIFAGQTNVSLADKPVVCFDLQDLPAELRPIVLFLISTYVWNISFGSRIPRQFVVDELLTLYQYAEGKRFLETLFQRARKHYLSVCGITQYPKVLLESTIPSNCATSIVMAQELASLPLVQQVFQLSETEVQRVRTFGKGEALLLSNDQRFAVRFEASEQEYACCTSDPADLIHLQDTGPMAASPSPEHPQEQEVRWYEPEYVQPTGTGQGGPTNEW